MKGLFPQYDNPNVVNYSETWKTALFVFDTNILLNLYRYQTNTSEELIAVIKKLSDRIWIPHHVALEFQRSRLSVISAQGRRFNELRNVINKSRTSLFTEISKLSLQKRHALIDSEALLSEFDTLVNKFLAQLEDLQQSQQKPTDPDPLKHRIEELFDGKVGTAFEDQKTVDVLSKEAETRYKYKIPPGYEDIEKDKKDPDEFMHNSVIYKCKYGDFFVWKQILDYAKKTEQKSLIFVTDDAKEDWWSLVDFNGTKTIGARPELIEEAQVIGGVNSFLMYKPEGFLQYAKNFLRATVSEETLNEVRDLSVKNTRKENSISAFGSKNSEQEKLAFDWLIGRHGVLISERRTFPDMIGWDDVEHMGYEVRSTFGTSISDVNSITNEAMQVIDNGDITSFSLILFAIDTAHADIAFKELCKYNNTLDSNSKTHIIIGTEEISNNRKHFKKLYEFPYSL